MCMTKEQELDQQIRLSCVDMATRVIGKPEYIEYNGELKKYQDDVVDVARKIYEFITMK